MVDDVSAHGGEHSPELVAFKLMHDIASVERVLFHSNPSREFKSANRRWILQTYSQCIRTVTSSDTLESILEDTPE